MEWPPLKPEHYLMNRADMDDIGAWHAQAMAALGVLAEFLRQPRTPWTKEHAYIIGAARLRVAKDSTNVEIKGLGELQLGWQYDDTNGWTLHLVPTHRPETWSCHSAVVPTGFKDCPAPAVIVRFMWRVCAYLWKPETGWCFDVIESIEPGEGLQVPDEQPRTFYADVYDVDDLTAPADTTNHMVRR